MFCLGKNKINTRNSYRMPEHKHMFYSTLVRYYLITKYIKGLFSWSKHVVLDGWDFAQIGHDEKVNPYRIQAKTCLVAESQ